jgi:hypothetical protein
LEVAREDAVRAKISAVSAAAGADLALEAAKRKAHHAEKSAAAELEAAVAERAATALKPGQAMTRAGADARLEAARAAVRAASAENEANIHAAVEAKKIAHFDVTLAASRFDRAAAELDRALSKVGVQVPLDEIVFIPKLPVRVQEVSAAVGSAASGPVVSVTDNHLIVRSALPLQAAPLVKPGMEVQIDEPAYGVKLKGLVEHVEQTPGTHGLDGYHVYLAVAVEDTALRLEGFSLRLTIPVVSTKGTVLAAPISAVSLGADGASRVTLVDDGRFATVIVEPGLAANGYVELSTRDEALRPGRLVVVGHMSPDQTNKVEERQAPRFDLSGLIGKVKNAYDALYQFALAALDSEAPSSTEAVRTQ